MRYLPLGDADRRDMLATIGAGSIDDLFVDIPKEARLGAALDLPNAQGEMAVERALTALAARNRAAGAGPSFIGAGAYRHHVPASVDHLIQRSEFLTAYTPYQPEISQGTLQVLFEFQTQVAQITGMDVANASLYDGASAVAEAVIMALNTTGRRRVLVAETVHPHYRAVLDTYLADLPATCETVPAGPQGTIGDEDLRAALDHGNDDDVACVVVQSPNVFGCIEPSAALFKLVHEQTHGLAVAVFNPIACGLLARPGTVGADIAVGEGQPLGIGLQYGGPYLGLFAARRRLMRKMPGRLIGQTVDAAGQRAFCLTLQTREQHIRGAKDTSNFFTNQGLLALRAAMYLYAIGHSGLLDTDDQC